MEKVLQINSADSQEFRQLLADVRIIKRQLEERSNASSTVQRHYRGEPIITKFEYLSRVNKGNTWFSSRKKQIRHFTHKDGSVWVFESEVDKYFEGHF